jgi:hypothetical protein
MGHNGGLGASHEWPGNMIATTSTPPTPTLLTDREALARARRTYEDLYRSLSEGVEGEDRERIDRVHARGSAAFDSYKPTGGFLPSAAADTLGVYLGGAADGDPDAKLAWFKMMPRMLVEVTAKVQAPLVFEPARWVTFEALNTTLHLDTNVVLSAHVSDVHVTYSGFLTTQLATWKDLNLRDWLIFADWDGSYRTRAEPASPAKGNRQSTLALAA